MSKTTAMTIASKRRLDLLDEMASSDFASLEEKTRIAGIDERRTEDFQRKVVLL